MKKSRSKNLFKEVPAPNVRRNLFDLSHEVKMTGKFGFIYPCMLMDVLPGDTVREETRVFLRFAPLLAPILHRCDVSVHSFFVPNRIICSPWQEFITGGQDGDASVVLPYITPAGYVGTRSAAGMSVGSLWDYMGLPCYDGSNPDVFSSEKISALPFRAAAKVWNDYYRDPNFDDEFDLNEDVQGDVSALDLPDLNMFRRAYEKDYFTSALPWAQRGSEVLIPMGGEADVVYSELSRIKLQDGSDPVAGDLTASYVSPTTPFAHLNVAGQTPSDNGGRIENIESVEFENAQVTINDLRRSFAVQRWLENNARGGARYTEQILSHFAVQVPDYRLQRAEYLGGGKQPVQISEVLAAAGGDAQPPVGDMAGHGISAGRSNRWTYRCQEHGWIIMFLSVTYKTAYQQGIPRLWSRQSKFDFAWPELANLGEQAILSKELYYSFDADADGDNGETFGYVPRYAEYKYAPDRVAGDFRSTLAFWHLGRIFTGRPTLDEIFTSLYEDGDHGQEASDRIFAVQDGTDYLWIQLWHECTVKRPLPYFGVPSGIS